MLRFFAIVGRQPLTSPAETFRNTVDESLMPIDKSLFERACGSNCSQTVSTGEK